MNQEDLIAEESLKERIDELRSEGLNNVANLLCEDLEIIKKKLDKRNEFNNE
jgi:hypothetical protein